MNTHEIGELLKDLNVMSTHCKNALQSLEQLKTRLEQLNRELLAKNSKA